jgi:hypothetical protein
MSPERKARSARRWEKYGPRRQAIRRAQEAAFDAWSIFGRKHLTAHMKLECAAKVLDWKQDPNRRLDVFDTECERWAWRYAPALLGQELDLVRKAQEMGR